MVRPMFSTPRRGDRENQRSRQVVIECYISPRFFHKSPFFFAFLINLLGGIEVNAVLSHENVISQESIEESEVGERGTCLRSLC